MNKILTSIWFLALVIAVPVIWFFPPVFDKYTAGLEDVIYNTGPIFNTYFVDLNSDGSKERIISFPDGNGRLCLQYYSKINAAPVDQLNFSHEFHNRLPGIYFDDVDKDGFTEIYGFTVHQDSLFLNWFEPYPEINGLEHSKFIARVGTFNVDKIDINIVDLYFFDINKDGTDDLVFPVCSGFSLKPRNIFVFDIKNDTVYHSEYTGRNQFGLNFADLNGDSIPEIIADNATSGNLKDSLGNLHIDNISWLQVFNPDLTPYFPPIPFTEGLVNGVKNFVVGTGQKSILTFHFDYNDSLLAKVFLFNKFGEKMDSLFLPQTGKPMKSSVFRYNENEFLIVEGKQLTRISSDLKILGTTILPIPEKASPLVLTNLFDDKQQLIFVDFPNNKLLILLEGFKRLVEIEFEKPIQSFTKWNNLGNGNFYVLSNHSEYYFHLRKNNLFYLKYPGYLLIYLLLVAFIWLLQAARMHQLREKYELQDQVRELQLKSLKNQLDPHFIFNTFNTIASVIKQGRNEEAYDVMIKFSKLVRKNMDGANNIYTPLKEEIDFVKDYLSIQKFRFSEMFEYNIKIDKRVNIQIEIPKLLIQIHVENALKHGIRPSQKKGLLGIDIKQGQAFIQIEIEDNGIGRKKSGKLIAENNGIGLKTIQQIVGLNNKKRKNKISQEIIDLKNEKGEPLGTKVVLKIKC